ncbi:MAG TPA: ATP-binding protein [Macromonas sp.]|nr:ATP-binding protein [Macromonas sp.]
MNKVMPLQLAGVQHWQGLLAWGVGWLLLLGLDGHIDLANQALLLVLVSAVAAVWLSPLASLLVCAAAVLAFNYLFVPPRGTFSVDLHQHMVLLGTTLFVSSLVALLMARLRTLARHQRLLAERTEQLRWLGERLRECEDEVAVLEVIRLCFQRFTTQPLVFWLCGALPPAPDRQHGVASEDEWTGLRLCAAHSQSLGPHTGRHEDQPAWYLPLRGRRASMGAVLMRLAEAEAPPADLLPHLQALCDQSGLALERLQALQAAAQARESEQSQALRNTLLTAIAHDHRTPLATILSAASALHDQAERLSPGQRQQLAATVVDEAQQLARLTDNTLQLARLGTPDVALHLDWESVEELVGAVVRRARQRWPGRNLQTDIAPAMPLLQCDAVLLVQLLDNLVDNALKYSAADQPVRVTAACRGDGIVLEVKDRGAGVPSAWRERIFDAFQRGEDLPAGLADAQRGAGVGLAVCRAIARVHGATLCYRARRGGGSVFELCLPLPPQPELAASHPGDEA